MISRKELQFVNQFARNVPFPGINYAKIAMKELKKALELYKAYYMNKEYNFIFSNGEEIDFEIMAKNLPHLLGIDYKNLTSLPMEETCSRVIGVDSNNNNGAFDTLTKIIDNADGVIQNDSNPSSFKILNYYKIMVKCNAFSRLSSFDQFNFGCINFDKDLYKAMTGSYFSPQSSKLFFTSSNETITPYFMMGIMYTGEQKYVPETIIAPENFADFFKHQTLILPTQILVSDNLDLNKLSASSDEKLQILNMYKYIINTFNTNSSIDIFADYENVLRDSTTLSMK